MIMGIIALSIVAAIAGLALGYAKIYFQVAGDPVADKVDALLPQTQCGQCGYPGCRPYAEAIAAGEADINRCVPGGETTVIALADLFKRDPATLTVTPVVPAKAVIDEQICIGCTLCIQACPVDAIVGAAKHMHQVIAEECTGCALCVPPCPVACISMIPIKPTIASWHWPMPDTSTSSNVY